MRITLALLFLVFGCNNGSGTAGDAATAADAASDAPTAQPDAHPDSANGSPDAPADAASPQPDAHPDAIGDAVILDGGGDAGPFSCAAGLSCAANQYCEPQCCGGCFAGDGGVCPSGATSCTMGAGAAGCNYCTAARCVNTIPLGCNPGGVGEPRRLFCLCG